MISIRQIRKVEDLRRCYRVMAQLRPHLDEPSFCEQVQRQFVGQDYHVTALERNGEILSVAGYRFVESLVRGRYLYVDDLVTDETCRGEGLGGLLFDWIVEEAERTGCSGVHLDSGIQRFAAHRFYLGKRMRVTSRHFGLELRCG